MVHDMASTGTLYETNVASRIINSDPDFSSSYEEKAASVYGCTGTL